MVYRLTLSYRGGAYAGWQRQTNAVAVQQRLEEALGQLLGEPVTVHGAGRTDAGVHARGQIAHFHLGRLFPEKGLVHGTNRFLPQDIRVLAAHRMSSDFHARKSAFAKEYLYRVYRGRTLPALEAPLLAQVEQSLDLKEMRLAAACLAGRHDFTAFALQGGSHTQPVRRLYAAILEEKGRELHLRFVGQGFLRGMVRSLVGTLLEIGEGRRPAADMERLLTGLPRSEAGRTAAAQGLSLERVYYGPRWRPMGGYVA